VSEIVGTETATFEPRLGSALNSVGANLPSVKIFFRLLMSGLREHQWLKRNDPARAEIAVAMAWIPR
jgi:hypothetical protein